MNKNAGKLIFTLLGSAAALTVGCDSASNNNPMDGGTDTGGTPGMKVPLTPDATGWIDKTTNNVMIQGAWFGYGDLADCTGAGHTAAECSVVTMPMEGSFPNTGGKMCTTGTAAKVLKNTAGMDDYSMMWGAGIGVDLNNSGGGATAVKMPYNATANKVIGFSFTIDMVPLGADGIRVEMPTPATRNTAFFKTLLSTQTGSQTVLFADMKQGSWVTPPGTFDATMVESVQFHVPTNTTAAVPYTFCISDFAAVLAAP